jgi:TetR/AcrR family transcriptional regulator, transcriptional repressor for nem operon
MGCFPSEIPARNRFLRVPAGRRVNGVVKKADWPYLPTGRKQELFMSDVLNAIIDSAERRIRAGGFSGFSFREVAADVGVKSSSVHYYFPTKEALAAAVIHRYTDFVSELIDKQLESDPDPIKVWTKAFRGTLHSDVRMCPATVMGAASGDLPTEVAAEVQRFFRMCLDKLVKEGLSQKEAAEFLATITGALVVANAIDEKALYDRATTERVKASAAVKRSVPRVAVDTRKSAARGPRRAAS